LKKQSKPVVIAKQTSKLHWLLIAFPIISIVLAYSNNTVDTVLMPKYICFSFSTLLITVFAYQYAIKNRDIFNVVKSHIFFKIYFVFLLVSFIGLQSSINYADGIFEWCKLFLLGLSIFSVAIFFNDDKRLIHFFTQTITILNAIIVLIGMVELIVLFQKTNVTHTNTYAITGTFGHKNIFSEMLFLTFPFAMYQVFTGNKKWKIFASISVIFTLFLITIGLTRAVWLSTIVGFVITFPMYLYALKSTHGLKTLIVQNKKNIAVILSLIAVIILSIIIYSRFDSFSTFKKQTISMSRYSYGSGGERIALWKKSYRVFQENPVFGTGLGSWKIKVLNYGHQGLETENNLTFHQRPHNDFIWILSEQGLIGLLLYLSMVLIILLSLTKLMLTTTDNSKKLFYFLALYMYIGYLIFSCFSFPKERIEHQIILVFVFAITIIETNNSKKNNLIAN
jgi:O-antigen ligase